MSLINNIN